MGRYPVLGHLGDDPPEAIPGRPASGTVLALFTGEFDG
jgi:hypothetical protein